jgi:hypothetical protein
MAGRHDEAEAMARRALDIRERALAPDDAAIAVSLELVAYFCAGRAKRTRSLADAERILGSGTRGTLNEEGSSADSAEATLEAELASLAVEEKSLRERARAIRSRPGASREPNTLERSPASDAVASAGPVAPAAAVAPVVEHDAAARESAVDAAPVATPMSESHSESVDESAASVASEASFTPEAAIAAEAIITPEAIATPVEETTTSEAIATPAEAEPVERIEVEHDAPAQEVQPTSAAASDDGEPLVVLHNCYAADDVAWGFQSTTVLQDAAAGAPADPPAEPTPDATDMDRADSGDVPEASAHATPDAFGASTEASPTAFEASAEAAPDSLTAAAFPDAEYQDAPVTEAEYIPAVIVPREELADAPVADEGRLWIADSLPAMLTGRRARWFLGVIAVALAGAGAGGFAIGRGGRAQATSSLAQVQQASRGSIEDSQGSSPVESGASSSDIAAQRAAAGAANAGTSRVREAVPVIPDWDENTPRARRQPRIPSRSQARRLSRTMERMGSKVMTGVDSKLDSIGRSVELPPPTFDKP